MRKSFPLKPLDSPSEPEDPAADLARYFSTPAYRNEVRRQRASDATLLELQGDYASYWAAGGYSHAASIAAAIASERAS